MARLWAWAIGSTVASIAAVSHAFYTKKHFYPAVVFLVNSNISMMFIYLHAAVMAFLAAKAVQKIFYPNLRAIEVEHLYERSAFAITETLLAMTIFRDEFSTRTAGMFVLLLILKCYHWLAQDRVDFMEQTPNINFGFHFRMITSSSLLFLLDALFVYLAYVSIALEGPSMQLLFGFEYGVLALSLIVTFVKYVLHTIDLRSQNPWDRKTTYILYLELIADFFKLLGYIVFFVIIINFYALPLHIIRDIFTTFQSFAKRLRDMLRSRRAINNMEQRYQNVTEEDLRLIDPTCIICREELTTSAKKLGCGHVFHVRCLRSWLEQQQTCPTCRANVLDMPPAAPAPVPAAAPAAAAAAAAAAVPGPHAHFHAHPHAHPHPHPHVPGAAPVPPAAPLTPQVSVASSVPPLFAFPPPPQFPFPPPFPFPGTEGLPPPPMFMPFSPPMPAFVPFQFSTAPADLSTLSDADLAAMEGQERRAVEERVRFLQSLRAEMDAMMARFGQYEAIARQFPLSRQGTTQDPISEAEEGEDDMGGSVSRNVSTFSNISIDSQESARQARVERRPELEEARLRRLRHMSSSSAANAPSEQDKQEKKDN